MHKMAANEIQATNTDLQFEFIALKQKQNCTRNNCVESERSTLNYAIQTMD